MNQPEVTAIIPLRSAIDFKETWNNKPLLYWILLELHKTSLVKRILILTNDISIIELISTFEFNEVYISNKLTKEQIDLEELDSFLTELLLKDSDQRHISSNLLVLQNPALLLDSQDYQKAIQAFSQNNFCNTASANIQFGLLQSVNRPEEAVLDRVNGSYHVIENGLFYILNSKQFFSDKTFYTDSRQYFTVDTIKALPSKSAILSRVISETLQERLREQHKILYEKGKEKLLIIDADSILISSRMSLNAQGESYVHASREDVEILHRIFHLTDIKVCCFCSGNNPEIYKLLKQKNIGYVIQATGNRMQVVVEVLNKLGLSFDDTIVISNTIEDFNLLSMCGTAFCTAEAHPKIRQLHNITPVAVNPGTRIISHIVHEFMPDVYVQEGLW